MNKYIITSPHTAQSNANCDRWRRHRKWPQRHGMVTTLPGHSPVGTGPQVAHRRPRNTMALTTWWKLHRDPGQCLSRFSPACGRRPVGAAERWTDPSPQCLQCGLWKLTLPPPAARGGAKALCTGSTEGGARSFLQTRRGPHRAGSRQEGLVTAASGPQGL